MQADTLFSTTHVQRALLIPSCITVGLRSLPTDRFVLGVPISPRQQIPTSYYNVQWTRTPALHVREGQWCTRSSTASEHTRDTSGKSAVALRETAGPSAYTNGCVDAAMFTPFLPSSWLTGCLSRRPLRRNDYDPENIGN